MRSKISFYRLPLVVYKAAFPSITLHLLSVFASIEGLKHNLTIAS